MNGLKVGKPVMVSVWSVLVKASEDEWRGVLDL